MFESTKSRPDKAFRWRCIETLLLALLFLAPLVFDPWGNNLSGQYKAIYINLAACLLAFAFVLRFLFGAGFRLVPSLADIPWLLFLIFAALSLLWSINPYTNLQRLTLLLSASLAFYLVRVRMAEGDGPLGYVMTLVVVGTATALIDSGCILHAVSASSEQAAGANAGQAFKTVSHLFQHNNIASIYIIVLIPLSFSMVFACRSVWLKVLSGVSLVVLVGYLSLLESRAALIEAGLGILLMLLLLLLRNRLMPVFRFAAALMKKKPALLFFIFLLLLVFLLPLSKDFSSLAKAGFNEVVSFFDLDFKRSFFRLDIWRKTMVMVSDNFWLGVGLGNFPVVFPVYNRMEILKSHAHSEYFNVLAELGVVGMLLYLSFLIMIFKSFLNSFLNGNNDRRNATLVTGLGCGLLLVGVHGFFEPPMIFEASVLNILVCSSLVLGIESAIKGKKPYTASRHGMLKRYLIPLAVLTGLVLVIPRLSTSIIQSQTLKNAQDAYKKQRFVEAEELFRKASTQSWESYYFHIHIGDICFRRGKNEQALLEYRKAEALFPFYFLIHFKKGVVLARLRRYEEALLALDKCCEYNPRWERYVSGEKARSFVHTRRYDEAVFHLDMYMQSGRPRIQDLLMAGRLYQIIGTEYSEDSIDKKLEYLNKGLSYYMRYMDKGGEKLKDEVPHIKHLIRLLKEDNTLKSVK